MNTQLNGQEPCASRRGRRRNNGSVNANQTVSETRDIDSEFAEDSAEMTNHREAQDSSSDVDADSMAMTNQVVRGSRDSSSDTEADSVPMPTRPLIERRLALGPINGQNLRRDVLQNIVAASTETDVENVGMSLPAEEARSQTSQLSKKVKKGKKRRRNA